MQTPAQTDGREPGALNHPQPAEWMPYLYGELPRAAKLALNKHLRECKQCREQVAQWRHAQTFLNRWKFARPTNLVPVEKLWPTLKWAMAALVVLGLGYGIGRATVPKVDVGAIRAAVEKPLRDSLLAEAEQAATDRLQSDLLAALSADPEAINTPSRQQLRAGLEQWAVRTAANAAVQDQRLLAKFAESYQANREQDHQQVLDLLERADKQHQTQYLSLRRAVETVAVVADDRLQRTESQLGQLASYTQAQFAPDPSNEPSTRQGN